ncbi:MAG: hypothetical protein EZS28_003170 [Streblomastix strix]|uniref:HMG box domain-containing protein n=1 Tax=Streblomastix strix TaxID=222440 RepID=A0A5J4X2A5_9EUKA|nr:MAG: hypothetical protein EZS28_003170 [Streblomastix strix]
MESKSDTNIPLDEQSAYKLFESEQLDKIKNEHPDWNQKELTSAIQIGWITLEESDKKDQLRKLVQQNDGYRKEDVQFTETEMMGEGK